MDASRAVQLLTDLAYFALGIAAVAAAMRSHERARLDVAVLFGSLGLTVVLQEIALLTCSTPAGCVSVPLSQTLSTILALMVPFALLRLVDDVADVPSWQLWVSLMALIGLGVALLVGGTSPPAWLVLLLTLYLVLGSVYVAYAFAMRARAELGITRRRMAAVAWGCGLLAAAVVLGVFAAVFATAEAVLTPLARLAGLVSGLCFWAGFFPPNWLSQTWRLPELFGYLRPTRLMAAPKGHYVATGSVAIERLCAATAATTGARRVLLILEDSTQGDLYLWGMPTARVPRAQPLVERVLRGHDPIVVTDVTPGSLPESVAGVFPAGTLPSTVILAPIAGDEHAIGILAAFADKGPMFVEDDREVVGFFAGEATVILHTQSYRENVNELEALREADRLKDEFLAVVSHELRTPLTAVTGYSDILLRKLSGPLNERQERQVTGIRDAARRLLALVNDLLDVSKLEAGTLDLRQAALEPRGAIERAVNAVRVIGVNKGVAVEVCEPAMDLPLVWADDERLQQILSNLLMNAIKFTPEGGSVWISAEADATEILFRVQDTGLGLAPGQESRVWERFYQGESASTRRFGGAGLGLAIVQQLTELHGGRVEAASAGPNLGSTFTVSLPGATGRVDGILRSVPQVRAPEPAETVDASAPVVLVVEDDAHIATVLRTYLETDGYRVEIAEDGHAAIQRARALAPFAITLDISLPKLDGWSVLNALKREPSTASIPVIVISIVDNRDFGRVLGATEYFVKPIDPERLRTTLQALALSV
jgi:signal transduction histidine kinase